MPFFETQCSYDNYCDDNNNDDNDNVVLIMKTINTTHRNKKATDTQYSLANNMH